MRRGLVLLGVGVIGIGILGWQLMRSLDDTPAVPTVNGDAAIATTPSPMRANQTTRTAKPPSAPAGELVLRGTIRDDAGAAIAGARVCVDGRSSLFVTRTSDAEANLPNAWDGLRCAQSATNGAYEIAGVPVTARFLTASAPRYQPASALLGEFVDGADRIVDLVLAREGVRVHGRVRDLDNRPIANALVGTTATATDGTFEIWTAPGAMEVLVRATGYATVRQRVNAPAQLDIALSPESTIAGTVVDASGQPVAGALVTADADAPSVTTAADGTFALRALAAGTYDVHARTFGLAGHTATTLALAQQLTGVTIRMERAYQVGIHVMRSDDTPCTDGGAAISDPRGGSVGLARSQPAGSIVDAVPAGTYFVEVTCPPASSVERLEVRDDTDVTYTVNDQPLGTLRVTIEAPGRIPGETDAMFLIATAVTTGDDPSSGEFYSVLVPVDRIAVAKVPPGTYTLRIASTSLEKATDTATVRANETTEHVLRVPAPTTGRLRVVAVDSDGVGVGRVQLHVTGRNVDFTRSTQPDGTAYMFVPGGDYGVSRGSASARAHVTNGATRDVRLVVPPLATIRGTVVDASGAPIADAYVSRLFGASYMDDGRAGTRRVAGDGTFAMPVMSEGPYVLSARRVGGGESPIVEVTDASVPVRLVVGGGGTIVGTVVDAAGKRVPSFSASVDQNRYGSTPLGTRPFTDGAIRWPNLAAGPHSVSVDVGHRSASSEVNIVDGARTNVTITLPPAFTITGRVVDAVSRAPIPRAELTVMYDVDYVYDANDQRRLYAADYAALPTDDDGRFTLDDAIVGAYRIAIKADAGHLPANQTVNVKAANVDVGEIALARARN